MNHSQNAYLPAAGTDLLLPLYDPLTTLLGASKLRRRLIEQAELQPAQRVLDVGCGTGTLLVDVKQRYPQLDLLGVDPDSRALARANKKAQRARVQIRFERGFAGALASESATFDRVLSSFMFHHLKLDGKRAMLREVERVLKPGGRLEMMDFAGHSQARSGFQHWIHSHAHLTDNAGERVLALMAEAGLREPRLVAERSLWFGSVCFYRAERG